MFFFFFFSDPPFKKGQACEIVVNDNRHYTMPKLFPDRIGKRVIISNVMSDHVWCYDDKPIQYRTNKNGNEVTAFDPRCVTQPYYFNELKVVKQSSDWLNDWLRS